MDYTSFPQKVIYRDRRSLEEFAEDEEVLSLIIDNMLDNSYLNIADAKDRALKCLNTSYYLCTLILLCDKHPEWNFALYCEIANCGKIKNKVYQAFTLSLVYIFLTHTYYEVPCKKLLKKLSNFLDINFLRENDPFRNDYSYRDLCDALLKDTPEELLIAEEFKPRVIDKETVRDVIMDSDFNWVTFVNYFEERIVRYVVKALGKTEMEKHNVIDILRQVSHGFYTSGYNDYPEHVDKMLDELDNDVCLQYRDEPNQNISQTISTEMVEHTNATPYEERIKQLEAEVSMLRQQQANQTSQNSSSQESIIDQQASRIKELEELYRIATEQVDRYESELGPIEKLDDWKEQLSIKERIIFFSAVTNCNLSPAKTRKIKQASQLAKAKLIARFSGGNPSKIRSGISLLNKEIEEIENKTRKNFSQGTLDAATNVYNYLHYAVEGVTIGNKQYMCRQAMQNINQTYHLNIEASIPPPKDENFLLERKDA